MRVRPGRWQGGGEESWEVCREGPVETAFSWFSCLCKLSCKFNFKSWFSDHSFLKSVQKREWE